MTLTFASIPEVSGRQLRRISRPGGLSRRSFLGKAAVAATAVSFAYLKLWDRAVFAVNDNMYFREWTNETTGPCAPGNYASNHTEDGRKCGPSYSSSGYCYTGSNTGTGEVYKDTENRRGWHKYGPYVTFGPFGPVAGNLYQRPDHCWASSSGSDYDSWQWRYSDGWVYGCSDGRACSFYHCFNTICPYRRHT